jgi:hypothetical protein
MPPKTKLSGWGNAIRFARLCEVARQKLRFTISEAPVGGGILNDTSHHVAGSNRDGTRELLCQFFVKPALKNFVTMLTYDRYNHYFVSSNNSETRVLYNEMGFGVGLVYLIAVTLSNVKGLNDGSVDRIEQSFHFRIGAPFDSINSY